MSSHDRNQPDEDSDEMFENLFAHAAPRPAPPAADAEEIRRAVYAEWDAVTGRRVFWRRAAGAIAAAAVVAGIAVLFVGNQSVPPLTVATIERVQGNVEIDGVAGARVGDSVPKDARVVTHGGQIAFRLADGGSLRLAAQTELELLAGAEIGLDAGSVYFDSAETSGPSKLAMRTAFGTLRDIGTQFMARLEADGLAVGVRDGRVALAHASGEIAADAGERITVPQGTGSLRRESIETFGPTWAWAEGLAPPFEIDGRRLIDFLGWVTHETGRALVFTDPAAERIARDTTLNGSIDLEPMSKLTAVLTLTDLAYSIDVEDRIVISVK